MQITYQPTVSLPQIGRATKRAIFTPFNVRQVVINMRYHITQIQMVCRHTV